MRPSDARSFWVALVENAAMLVVDADKLGPTSPRAQSLVILAQEELGKAYWISSVFWETWLDGDETPRAVPLLGTHSRAHIKKLMDHHDHTADFQFLWHAEFAEGDDFEVSSEISAREAEAILLSNAKIDNDAKQQGFYVDRNPDGSLSVPHRIVRPHLADEIAMTASMVLMHLSMDAYEQKTEHMSGEKDAYALVEPIYLRYQSR